MGEDLPRGWGVFRRPA